MPAHKTVIYGWIYIYIKSVAIGLLKIVNVYIGLLAACFYPYGANLQMGTACQNIFARTSSKTGN